VTEEVEVRGSGRGDDSEPGAAIEPRHGDGCECVRCVGFQPGNTLGFQPGNTLSTVHGALSKLRIPERAAELADGLRAIVPAFSDADEPTVRLLATVLARVEAANVWVAEHGLYRDDAGELQPVLRALSTWENTAARLLNDLGCTPTSRARLGLDLSRATGGLAEYLAERYAEPDVVTTAVEEPEEPEEPESGGDA